VQFALPLHYYLFRHDKRDERFAWRMFSPTRIERCGTQFFLGDSDRPIRASKYFHNAWVGLAQRGRQQVVESMAQRLCKDHPGQAVRVRIQCEQSPHSARGRRDLYDPARRDSDERIELVSAGAFDFCTTGSL
jgi:hypothetical protein